MIYGGIRIGHGEKFCWLALDGRMQTYHQVVDSEHREPRPMYILYFVYTIQYIYYTVYILCVYTCINKCHLSRHLRGSTDGVVARIPACRPRGHVYEKLQITLLSLVRHGLTDH